MMKILDRLEEWIIALLMGAATLIVFIAVLHRYMAGYAIPGLQDWLLSINMTWAQELTIIMFVWMAKFGAAYGVRTGIHVGVDVLINRLNPTLRARFVVFGLLAGALFTGIVATLNTGRPGPTLAFRVDMDALDLSEALDESHRPFRDGFASCNPGMMHACAHDGHTTIGLGLAQVLKQNEAQLNGTIRLIFQPAEEGTRGAKAIVDKGVVDDVQYISTKDLYCPNIEKSR